MPGDSKSKDIIIVILSTVSLIVSGISLWESDQNRKLSFQTAQDGKELQTKLNRPWVTVSSIKIVRAMGRTAVRFSLTNTGSSPAMLLKACPVVSSEEDTDISKEVDDVEHDASMDMNILSQGQTGDLLMPLDPRSEVFSALQQGKKFRYAIRWSYQGILTTKHRGKQLGFYDSKLQSFTLEGPPTFE